MEQRCRLREGLVTMCCHQKEMQAEGKKVPTDQWFSVKEVPCCIPKVSKEPDSREKEREHGFDTGIPCGACKGTNTLRLLRTVREAEQHDGEELPVSLCELGCPCGSTTVYTVEVATRLAAMNGVSMHV